MTNENTSFQIPELHYSALFEALAGNNVLLLADPPRFSILACSPTYLHQTGYTKEAMVGKGIFEAFPASPDPANTGINDLKASLNYVLQHQESHQLPQQRYDVVGEDGQFAERYWKAVNKPVFSPDGRIAYIIHTAEDITDEVKAGKMKEQISEYKIVQEQLQTALEQARLSKEAAELGTFDIDVERGIMHWDDRCRILFGISHHNPVSYEEDFVKGLHPDDRDRIISVIDRLYSEPIANGDYDVEYRTVGAEDNIIRWVRAKGRVYYHQDKPVRFIGSVLDITEKVMALQKIENLVEERTKELAIANETLNTLNIELQRSNQNLEEFAHAASHDLKEPVRKIHIFTQQLKDQLSAHMKVEQIQTFDKIGVATERMRNLIDDLLLYSHVSHRPLEMESVDLNNKVRFVLEELEPEIAEKKAVVKVTELPVVKGYRRQLQQMFQNLIGNALKYSKEDVTPSIQIAAQNVTENGKPYYLITVKDNGIGFDQDYSEKIFQMFTRLHGKSEYRGSGVGLSIVKRVVENHNGFIKVKSTPGEGASFMIYLPML